MTLRLTSLWGKADGAADGTSRYHPAICHMIDVGNVAMEFVRQCCGKALRNHLVRPLAGDEGTLALLVALHDLGKLTPAFQRKRPDLCPDAVRFGAPLSTDHGAGSTYLVSELLQGRPFGWGRSAAWAVASAVGGHHGVLRSRDRATWCAPQQIGDTSWEEARAQAVAILLEIFVSCEIPCLSNPVDGGWLVTLAGFTSVMDWIGSMEDPFAYEERVGCLREYAQVSRERARQALERLNWLGWRASGQSWGADIFGRALGVPMPRAMQAEVLNAVGKLGPGPKLVIVEAPTGQGKTEAALAIAERWLHGEDLQGLYYGLPTQATSNQMFGRVANFLSRRYASEGLEPELHLLHGNRLFQPLYRDLSRGTALLPTPSSVLDGEDDRGGREAIGSIRATEWFRGRKRGLLGHFGVGTVDQALFGVLRLRHQAVRLFGLSAKVVVLDEVHAYDAYMTRELERLCQWARATGASVVMLSATLPQSRRDAFVRAFGGQPDVGCKPYPSLTMVAQDCSTTVPLSAPATYTIKLEPCSAELVEEAPEQLLAPIDKDGSVAWICNTVDEAQRTYEKLRQRVGDSWDVMLFHARMPLRQRLEVEGRALSMFGKGRESSGRRLIVATQVIEQSLDLDFDLLVSEICPIDLLLQRIGRLHRHVRSDRPPHRCPPTVRLIQPWPSGEGIPEWGANAYVYEPYTLLATWKLLDGRPELTLPKDTRPLIEAVYGGGSADEFVFEPGPLREALDRARQAFLARAQRDVGTANFALLPPPTEFEVSGNSVRADLDEDDDVVPVTRLGARGVRAALVFGDASRARFEPGSEPVDLSRPPSPEVTQQIVMNSVTLGRRGERLIAELQVPQAWRRTPLLRATRLVCLDDDGRWAGQRGGLRWDSELGVVYEQP